LVTSRSFVVGLLKKNFFRHGYRKYEFPHSQGQNPKKLPVSFIEDFYSRTLLFVKTLNPAIANGAILDQFRSGNIAIVATEAVLMKPNGQFMAAMTVNLLSRLCPNLTLVIPESVPSVVDIPLLEQGFFADALVKMAYSINPFAEIALNPIKSSRYAAILAVSDGPKNIPPTVTINSDGWISYVDTNGNSLKWVSENSNPVGAYTSACLGVTEVFKRLLYRLTKKESFSTLPVGNLVFSSLDYGFGNRPFLNPPLPSCIRLGSLHFISMGALNSAVLYTLCSLGNVSGDLTFVEPQNAEVSNLNRYVILSARDCLEKAKKVTVADQIASAYFQDIEAHDIDFRTYRSTRRERTMDLAIVGVDNNEGRWEVQMDLPNLLICGGTERAQVTVSCHDDVSVKACAGCVYFDTIQQGLSTAQPIPTISFVSALCGVLMAAEVLKAKVMELSNHRLNLLLNIESLRGNVLEVRKPPKSPNCGCNCATMKVWGVGH